MKTFICNICLPDDVLAPASPNEISFFVGLDDLAYGKLSDGSVIALSGPPVAAKQLKAKYFGSTSIGAWSAAGTTESVLADWPAQAVPLAFMIVSQSGVIPTGAGATPWTFNLRTNPLNSAGLGPSPVLNTIVFDGNVSAGEVFVIANGLMTARVSDITPSAVDVSFANGLAIDATGNWDIFIIYLDLAA